MNLKVFLILIVNWQDSRRITYHANVSINARYAILQTGKGDIILDLSGYVKLLIVHL